MKADELMIGDWVASKEKFTSHGLQMPRILGQITQITEDNRVEFAYRDRWQNRVYISLKTDEVEPIPLTADILKDNGIELFAIGDNGAATPPKWRNRLEQWHIHTQWKDTNLWFDRLTKKYRIQDTNAIEIEFVHQLQQTLRLAKIEKEIVL